VKFLRGLANGRICTSTRPLMSLPDASTASMIQQISIQRIPASKYLHSNTSKLLLPTAALQNGSEFDERGLSQSKN
jgi:hypothetical protein